MHARTLWMVGIAGAIGWSLHRAHAPAASQTVRAAAPIARGTVGPRPIPALEPTIDGGARATDGTRDPPIAIFDDAPPYTIHGQVLDVLTGAPLADVVVVATSALEGDRLALTDANGEYTLAELPAGDYTVTVYDRDVTVWRSDVAVVPDHATAVDIELDPEVPVFGSRPIEPVLQDSIDVGTSFSSSCPNENTYIIDF